MIYYEHEEWASVKDTSLTPVAFPAFIVLPTSASDEPNFKFFIFGGLELDIAT